MSRPISNDREYGEEEIWNNFKYFMDRALPVCEEAGVKLALHPNDPPVPSLGGVESENFGNLMDDIKTFCQEDKISIVHFRNVSSVMPYFEETLLEDGYADMYAIMKQLIQCGYNGYLNIDHPFFNQDGKTISDTSAAYFMGYMKGMLHSAEKELSAK